MSRFDLKKFSWSPRKKVVSVSATAIMLIGATVYTPWYFWETKAK